MTKNGDYQDVLRFWFGDLDEHGRADQAHTKSWFTKDSAFDAAIRERFGAVHEGVANGEHDAWLDSPRGRLAFVVVLDQFSRNMFRDTAAMFAFDARAFEVAREGVDRGIDRELGYDERSFLYMPFMHAENRGAQERCVALFTAWRDELDGEMRGRVASSLDYAEKHRDIVARFGRFPHRNAILGRASTQEEREFLAQPGSSF